MFYYFTIGLLTAIAIFILLRLTSTVIMMWKVNGVSILPHLLVLIFLLFLASCSKEDVYPDVCIDGNCNAKLILNYPIDENGYYHVKLDYEQEYKPRFHIEIEADNINDYWRYNGRPVAFAIFNSDASRMLLGDEVKLVQETEVYLSEVDPNKLYGKRIIGPVVNQFKGDTITVDAKVYWDGGVKLYEKYQKTLKIILE